MIYVMGEVGEESGPVKIGLTGGTIQSNSAVDRANQLQTGNWRRLVVVAMLNGGEVEEQGWHRAFAAAHVLGEWFRRTPEVEAFISAHACEPIPATCGTRNPLDKGGGRKSTKVSSSVDPADLLHYASDPKARESLCYRDLSTSFVVRSLADWIDDDITLERCEACHARARVLVLPRKSASKEPTP